jgi:flagellar basal-body rod protein FlgC
MLDSAMGEPSGVSVANIIVDPRDPEQRYLPGHPDADANGYVAFPRINPAEEMVDLMSASRGYQANVASMSALKGMIQNSIDLLRYWPRRSRAKDSSRCACLPAK